MKKKEPQSSFVKIVQGPVPAQRNVPRTVIGEPMPRCEISGVILNTKNRLHAAVEREISLDDGAARTVRVSQAVANWLDEGISAAEIRAYCEGKAALPSRQ